MSHFPTAYYLPDGLLTNEELAALYPEWPAEKILAKTGISERRVCSPGQVASDLAECAARRLFEAAAVDPASLDFVILGTQSPDYPLPTTACLLQNRLGIPRNAGAFDFNLGCSAFVYGLAIAKGLLLTNSASRILLLMAEAYSRYVHPMDKSVRTLFGDAGAAMLLTRESAGRIGEFVLGTDGSGGDYLIVPVGGSRAPREHAAYPDETDEAGNTRAADKLRMDGPEVFNFTISTVPKLVQETLERNAVSRDDIQLFVFHQANKYMLEHLRKQCRIAPERFFCDIADCGNTVSASIPIALARAESQGRLKAGDRVMVVGFGVGLSWGATVLTW